MAHEPGSEEDLRMQEWLKERDEEEEEEEEEEDEAEDGRALTAPSIPIAERYDFPVPEHIAVIDLLAIELGEMVRVTRFLTDTAMERNQDTHERMQTIHAIGDVVGCSGKLAEYMDRMRSGYGWKDVPPSPRLPARRR